jgi:hypothetical protein
MALRIPKPFEIGAMATLAERGADFMWDKSMTGSRYGKIMVDLLMDNLSMNPIPQAVKPILDVYSNKDSFSGRAIESQGMEKMAPDYRFNAGSSMIARGISTAGQSAVEAVGLDRVGGGFLSPLQVDHLLRGYFGWMGSFAVASADLVLRDATSQPTRPTPDYFKIGTQNILAETASGGSYYTTALYDQAKIVEQTYATYHGLAKTDPAKAAQYFRDNVQDIAKYKSLEEVKKQESKLNEAIRMVERSNLDPDVKKAQIQRYRDMQDRVARSIVR